jgi:ATP-dependent DNA helicase RecQ
MDLKSARQILQNRYKHPDFRGLQSSTITSLAEGHDTLLVMPTGSGKSLCYQIPSELLPGLTIVVSPLIALMKDQVDRLKHSGFPGAAALHSGLSGQEKEQILHRLRSKSLRLIYVTPERFRNTAFVEAVTDQVVLFVVDEAHCISQWGHDFRPEYSRLAEVRASLGNPLTLALTATASPRVREDIVRSLCLSNATILVDDIERPNLYLGAMDCYGLDEKTRAAVGLRYRFPGSGIIYFSLISSLYKFAEQLRSVSVPFGVYHGDLAPKERIRAQEQFLALSDQLLLATPAFGLGVDKSDIRLVIHAEPPGSLEAYYQEVGRAGRDGQPSHCFLLYDDDDVSTQMEFLKWSNPDPGFVATVFERIRSNIGRVQMEGFDYLKPTMNFYNSRDYRVETTMNILARFDVIEWPHRDFKKLKVIGDPPPEILDEGLYQQRYRELQKKLLSMVEYSHLKTCRKQAIYQYFGQVGPACGFCDICSPLL